MRYSKHPAGAALVGALLVSACTDPSPVAVSPAQRGQAGSSALQEEGKRVVKLTGAFLQGKWSYRGSCAEPLVLRPDGTLSLPFMDARWRLSGNQLTVTGEDVPPGQIATVEVIDRNSIRLIGRNGKTDAHRRC